MLLRMFNNKVRKLYNAADARDVGKGAPRDRRWYSWETVGINNHPQCR